MLNLLIFMLACFSMTSVVVDQKIFEDIRSWVKNCAHSHPTWITKKICQLISCHFCTGFWCGVFLAAFIINPFNLTILDPFLGGLIGSFSAYYLNIAFAMLEKYAEARFGVET